MSREPWVIRWRQRTADGLRWRYRCRNLGPSPVLDFVSTHAVDGGDDFPWVYWSFKSEDIEAQFEELFPSDHYPDDDDTLDTPPPVPVVVSPEQEAMETEIMTILQDEIQKEIVREIRAEDRLRQIKEEAAMKSKLRATQHLIDGVIDRMMKR
jgi:hypothetical protein